MWRRPRSAHGYHHLRHDRFGSPRAFFLGCARSCARKKIFVVAVGARPFKGTVVTVPLLRRPPWRQLLEGKVVEHLTIPLISNEPVNIGEKRLFEHELGEFFHEGP